LDEWEQLNVEMDLEAKRWLNTLMQQGYVPTSKSIPREGWSIWRENIKLSSLDRSLFDQLIQAEFSTRYWKQPKKLGALFEHIEWAACGTLRNSLPISRRVWMTKWVTGWLPVAKNMHRWGMWESALCPVCQASVEDMAHLTSCTMSKSQPQLQAVIQKFEQQLLTKKVAPVVVSLVLNVFYPDVYPLPSVSPIEMIATRHWQRVLNQHPGTWGFCTHHWHDVMLLFPPLRYPTRHFPHRWLVAILSLLWNHAWDLWGFRNGIVHHQDEKLRDEGLRTQIQQEYMVGPGALPQSEHHWFQEPLAQLLQRQPDYLLAWLQTISVLRQCHPTS